MVDGEISAPGGLTAVLTLVAIAEIYVSPIETNGPRGRALIPLQYDDVGEDQAETRRADKEARCRAVAGVTLDPGLEVESLVVFGYDAGQILIEQRNGAADRTDMNSKPVLVEDKNEAIGQIRPAGFHFPDP